MTGYDEAEADVEFGGMGVNAVLVGSWGSFWRKFKGVFKAVFKGMAHSKMAATTVNTFAPGAGNAMQSGMQLIESAKAGDKTSLEQIKAIADAAKAGDTTKQGAHDMLKTINDAHNEAKAELKAGAAVGKSYPYWVKNADGSIKKHSTLGDAQKWLATHPGSQVVRAPGGDLRAFRKPGQQPGQRPGQRPATQQDVAQAMRRVPPQQRPRMAQMVQQAQLQGRYPMQPPGAPPYGAPYGMQPGQPFGYGVPQGMQYPYGRPYYDEGYAEQSAYYGDDEELAAAFAEDVSFPDEAAVQE